MPNRFLVAYDASPESHGAFLAACHLAAALNASVLALHVLEPTPQVVLSETPAIALDPMMPPVSTAPVLAEWTQRETAWARERLSALRAQAEALGVSFSERVDAGSVLDVLRERAGPDDVIAVGAKGRFARAGIGSSTKSLVTSAPCPVLVSSGTMPPPRAVLAAYDGTACAVKAVRTASELAGKGALPLTVLAVPRASGGQSVSSADLAKLEAQAAGLAPGARLVVLPGDGSSSEPDLLARAVGEDASALFVLGAYADSFWRELFFGSTTSHALSKLKGPVLLVHSSGAGAS